MHGKYQLLGNSSSGKYVILNLDLSTIANVMRFLSWFIECPENKLLITPPLPGINRPLNLDRLVAFGQNISKFMVSVYQAKTLLNDIWSLGGSAEEEKQRKKYIDHLNSIGPMTCGGGLLDRVSYMKAIKLGIKTDNLYGLSEGGLLLESDVSIISSVSMRISFKFFDALQPDLIDDVYDNPTSPNEDISEEILDKAYLLTPLSRSCRMHFEKVNGLNMKGEDVYELVLDATDPLFSSPTIANDGTNWRSGDLFRKKVVKTRSNKEIEGYLYVDRVKHLVMCVSHIFLTISSKTHLCCFQAQ